MNLSQSIPLNFDYANKHYEGEAVHASENASSCPAFDIFIDDEYAGTIVKSTDKWRSDNHLDKGLLTAVGGAIVTLLVSM